MIIFPKVFSVGLVLAILWRVSEGSDTCDGDKVCAAEVSSDALDQADDGEEEEFDGSDDPGNSLLVRNASMTNSEVSMEDASDETILEEDDAEDKDSNEGLDEEEQEEVGERRRSDSESAAEALMEEAAIQERADREEFLNKFQTMLEFSMGSNGAAVVMRFDRDEEPCPSNAFLDETFVHADMMTGTFVCKPCHAACTAGCTGADKADCLNEPSASSLAGVSATMSAESRSAFAESFAIHLQTQTQTEEGLMSMAKASAESDMTESTVNMTQCIADGTCSVTEVKVTETSSVDTSNPTVEVVHATALKGNLTDPTDFKSGVLKAHNKAMQDAGFIPGMTTEAPMEDETDDITAVTEDGPPSTPPGADSGLKQGSLIELEEQRNCESIVEARLNASLLALSKTKKKRIKDSAKDWVKTKSKEKAKDYAKQSIKEWLAAQEGDCVNALDDMIGASQRMYACVKENYENVKKAFCEPPKQHAWLLPKLKSVVTAANLLKKLSFPFKTTPTVNGVASNVHKVSGQVDGMLSKRVKTLENMKKKPHGTKIKEQPGCCYPFPEKGCSDSPGASYKCASCSAGGMCHVDRGCHTLEKLEEKMDEWKEKYYDPLLEKVAEATQSVQAADNAAAQVANAKSWLAKCSGTNFNKCSEVKKITDKIVGSIDSVFTKKFCPIKAPKIPFPDINPIKSVLSFLAKIADAFGKLDFELKKMRCVNVPRVKTWTERKCTRVCTPCCSYSRRRRLLGSVRCNSCCNNVCVKVPKVKTWTEKFCFSGMNILKGIGGFIQKFLGPVLKIIEKAVNLILTPVKLVIDKILGLLNLNVDFKFPSLPTFDFNLPTLPAVDCNTLKSFAR